MWLLPVWLLGAGEFGRFGWNSASPGPYERSGSVKGRDFVQFYVAGTLARERAWSALYDTGELERAVARVVPAAAGQIPAPVYAPTVAAFFSPLSTLSYVVARWLWFLLSAVVYFIALYALLESAAPLRGHRALAWITAVCNPLFAIMLSSGQTGAFLALAWALASVAFYKKRMVLFGMLLGIVAYKPPLLVGSVIALAVLDSRAALLGAALSVLGQLGVGILTCGVEAWRRYVAALAALPQNYYLTDTVPQQKQSVFGFFQLLLGTGTGSTLLSIGAAASITSLWWVHRRQPVRVWMVPMLAATSILLSPHSYVYDLVLLIPAIFVIADTVSRTGDYGGRAIAVSGYVLLFAPYSAAFATYSHIQLSTVALVVFLILTHRRWSHGNPG